MKKGKRFIRQRVNDSDSDGEKDNSNEENKTLTNDSLLSNNKTASLEKNKLTRVSTTSSILSFEIEEEGEDSFKIKKSSHNRKAVKQLKKTQKHAKVENENLKVQSQKKINFDIKKKENKIEENDCFEEDENDDSGDNLNTKNRSKHFSEILKSGGIPDANLIHLLKQKRQQAKGEDFIALDNTATTSSKSRLIREDDNDASDDEGCSNMMSSVSQKNKDLERRRIEETILTAQDESDSEKEQGWEELQMKKAMSDNQFLSEHKNPMQTPFNSFSTSTCYNQVNGQVMAAAQKSLRQKLQEARERYRRNKHDREEVQARMRLSLSDSERLSACKDSLDDRYKFYQQMQSFVLDYVDCMNEKMSSITYLERCMTQLLQQRAERLVSRRHDDVADQSTECQPGKTTGVDDAGDEVRKRRRAEREGRRARRRRGRDGKRVAEHKDGWSTDDQLTHSEENKFKNEKERLEEGCKSCMDDVLEQFHSVPLILSRFSQWKAQHHDSYSDAYIGLCLSRLLSPLIRLQLIIWNPLETFCRNFEKSPWFIDLLNYGDLENNTHHKNNKDKEIKGYNTKDTNTNDNCNNRDNTRTDHTEGNETSTHTKSDRDPDIKLLPNVIDKILVDKLTGVVDSTWDPMSSEQSRALRKVVGQVLSEYSLYIHDSKHLPSLIAAINKRLVKSIDNDLYIPLYPRASIEDRNNPASTFFYRQLHTCLKAFCNTLLWQGVLSDQHLQILALDRILNRYLLIAIQSAPPTSEVISACQCIASSVPEEWFSEYLEGVCIPQLQQFCKVVLSMAQKVHASATNDCKAQVKQLGKVLLTLHAEAQAGVLCNLISSPITLD